MSADVRFFTVELNQKSHLGSFLLQKPSASPARGVMLGSSALSENMRESFLALLLIALTRTTSAQDERIRFVNEYIRGLSQVVELRVEATRTGSKEDTGKIAECVKNGSRLEVELGENVRMMRRITLSGQNKQSPETIARIWEQELAAYQKLTDMCTIFMQGPEPGLDYIAVEAEAPKVAANIEYLDRMLFQSSPLVCAALVGDQSDVAEDHPNRLILRRQERDELVATLNSSLPDIDKTNPGYLTSAAKVVKIFLTKSGHRTADE